MLEIEQDLREIISEMDSKMLKTLQRPLNNSQINADFKVEKILERNKEDLLQKINDEVLALLKESSIKRIFQAQTITEKNKIPKDHNSAYANSKDDTRIARENDTTFNTIRSPYLGEIGRGNL